MDFKDYDLALITDEKQRLYFLGFHSTAGYVAAVPGKTYFVVDSRYYDAARRFLAPKGVEVVLGSDYSFLRDYASKNGVKRVGIDYSVVTMAEYAEMKTFGFSYTDIGAELISLMSVKTEEEIGFLAKACDIAERAWAATLPFIKKGVTEKQVAAELEYNFRKFGASGTSFPTIVAFGKNAAVPHHETDDTALGDDECVLMDFGCLYRGYCSDMTRTMFYGTPTEEFLDAYSAVYDAHRAAAEGIRPGMTGVEADAIARNVLKERGYGEYFTHSLGHGIGVNIHEFPRLSPKSDSVLKDNMVFSNEPGVYLDGKFGIRIEDSAHLENGVYKSFMKDDKRLVVLRGGRAEKYGEINK